MDIKNELKGDIELEEPGAGEDGTEKNPEDNSEKSGAESKKDSESKKGAWISQLPKNMRDSFNAEELPTQVDLAKKYLELKSELAKKGTDEPKRYSEDDYADIDRLFAESSDGDRKIVELMKKNNVAPEEIKSLVDGAEEERRNAAAIRRETLGTELRARWGTSYDANKAFFNRAVKTMFSDEDRIRIQSKGLNFDPDYVDAIAKLAKAYSEGTVPDTRFVPKEESEAEIMFGKRK